MTTIEWTRNPDGTEGKSWNPIVAYRTITDNNGNGARLRGWHCEHVHGGCEFCYAESQNIIGARGGTRLPYKPGHRKDVEIELHEETLLAPLHWKKPQRIFVCSMTDLFGAWVKAEWLDKLFAIMALCPQHTFIILTKRPERMREYLSTISLSIWMNASLDFGGTPALIGRQGKPLPNVWGLVSCSVQEDADKFIPQLLQTPLALRGVSLEPLLGPIDLTKITSEREYINALTGDRWIHLVAGDAHGDVHSPQWYQPLNWVIAGGESGKKPAEPRPMHPDWPRGLRDQCKAAAVPFFFKQWGEYHPSAEHNHDLYGCNVTPAAIRIDGKREWQSSEAYARLASRSPGWAAMCKLGKKNAGRLLDGVEHNEFPVTT